MSAATVSGGLGVSSTLAFVTLDWRSLCIGRSVGGGVRDAYRKGYVSKGRPAPGADRFAYLGLVAVANDENKVRRRGELVAGYLRSSSIVHIPFRNPPGFLSVQDNARMLRGETPPRSYTKDHRPIDMRVASVEELINAGILFCGTPGQVYAQLVDFCEYCGGMGNLLMMGHAGFLSHEDTVDNLALFAKEVLPRLKEYKQPDPEAAAVAAIAKSDVPHHRPGDLVDATMVTN